MNLRLHLHNIKYLRKENIGTDIKFTCWLSVENTIYNENYLKTYISLFLYPSFFT